MNIIQDDDISSSIDAGDKLYGLEPFPLPCPRRRHIDSLLTADENSSFMSFDSSLGSPGLAESSFCAFYASHFQQKLPKATTAEIVARKNALRVLRRLGTRISFLRPSATLRFSTLVSANASGQADNGHLSYLAQILFGGVAEGGTMHVLSCQSVRCALLVMPKCRQPLKQLTKEKLSKLH